MPWDDRNTAARARLRRVIDRLSETDLVRPRPSGWSTATVLAHLAFWDRFTLVRWQEMQRSKSPPVSLRDVTDMINAAGLAQWSAMPPERAVQDALGAAEAVDAFIAALPEQRAREIVGTGFERLVDRSVHRDEHLDEIEAEFSTRG
jgi:DinB family protein